MKTRPILLDEDWIERQAAKHELTPEPSLDAELMPFRDVRANDAWTQEYMHELRAEREHLRTRPRYGFRHTLNVWGKWFFLCIFAIGAGYGITEILAYVAGYPL